MPHGSGGQAQPPASGRLDACAPWAGFLRRDRPGGKGEEIYCELYRKIRELALPPGAQLRNDVIAGAHGVSRSPVREAVARLAEDALVDVRPRHGSFVASIRAHDVREALLICTALETEGIRRTAGAADGELLGRLTAGLAVQAAALRVGDFAAFDDLGDELHAGIFGTWESPRALRVLAAARVHVERAQRLALPDRVRAEILHGAHRRAVEAIATGDAALAAVVVRTHHGRVAETLEIALGRIAAGSS